MVEQGTHEELLAMQGFYWRLVQADLEQQQSGRGAPEPLDEEDEDLAPGEAVLSHLQRVQSIKGKTLLFMF